MPTNNFEPAEQLRVHLQECLDALLYKDRQAYLGGVVQGLIHNINGPLQNMSMLAELITAGQERTDRLAATQFASRPEDWTQLQDKQNQRLKQISDQIAKVVEMLRDLVFLLELERSDGEVDVNVTVTRLLQVLRADLFFKHQVVLDLKLTPRLPLAAVASSQFILAAVHLFRNAMLAMRDVAERHLIVQTHLTDNHIWLSFRDSGCGFPPDQVGRLFEPFYSGWPVDAERQEKSERSLGLGLFMARAALQPFEAEVILAREDRETVASLKMLSVAGKG